MEQGSVDGLPTSLVLVEKENGEGMKVIAHSKISAVPYKPELCFVESGTLGPQSLESVYFYEESYLMMIYVDLFKSSWTRHAGARASDAL